MDKRHKKLGIWLISIFPLSVLLLKTAVGQNEPGSQPTPAPSPAWSEVAETRSCPDATCPAGRGFTVDKSGVYRSGQGADGKITTDELQRLSQSANSVAKQDLSGPIACDGSGAEKNVNITLTKTDTAVVIYEGKADGTLCHRGETGLVVDLKNQLDQLAEKYDQQPATIPGVNECADKADGISCGTPTCNEQRESPIRECRDKQCLVVGEKDCDPLCFGKPDNTPCGPMTECPPEGGGFAGGAICKGGNCAHYDKLCPPPNNEEPGGPPSTRPS